MILSYDTYIDPFDNKNLYRNYDHVCTDHCNYNIVFAFSKPEVILSGMLSYCTYVKAFSYMAYLRRYRKNTIEKLYDPMFVYNKLIENKELIENGNYKYLTGLLDTMMDYDETRGVYAAIAGSILKMESIGLSLRGTNNKLDQRTYLQQFIHNRNVSGPVMANPNNADNIINTLSRCYDYICKCAVTESIFVNALKKQLHPSHSFIIMNSLFPHRRSYEIKGYQRLMNKLGIW